MHHYLLFYHSPVGIIKVQCNDQFVLSVKFIEEADETENRNSITNRAESQLQEYFEGGRQSFTLPIQQSGTLFQAKVWELLYAIPYGKTISYNDLAKQYGNLKAIRAVAAANGKNNLAIIVPCHRVIGSNASLTGYAGGLWRKKWLLQHEARFYAGVQQLPF